MTKLEELRGQRWRHAQLLVNDAFRNAPDHAWLDTHDGAFAHAICVVAEQLGRTEILLRAVVSRTPRDKPTLLPCLYRHAIDTRVDQVEFSLGKRIPLLIYDLPIPQPNQGGEPKRESI